MVNNMKEMIDSFVTTSTTILNSYGPLAGVVLIIMESIMKVENVSKTFGTGEALNKVLDNVSLEIEKGEFASLMGESGSGKSAAGRTTCN